MWQDNFNFSPDYEELQEFFRDKLRKWSAELDKLDNLEKFIVSTEDKKYVNDLSVLVKSNVVDKIHEFEKRGFKVSESEIYSNGPSIIVDKEKRQVMVPKDLDTIESSKTIEINNKAFTLKLDLWEITDDFPACKMKGNMIIINQNYPLFKNKKFVDIFVKLHSLLIFNVENQLINKNLYKSILKDIDSTFSDYKY